MSKLQTIQGVSRAVDDFDRVRRPVGYIQLFAIAGAGESGGSVGRRPKRPRDQTAYGIHLIDHGGGVGVRHVKTGRVA